MATDSQPTLMEWVLTRLDRVEGIIIELREAVKSAIDSELEGKAEALKTLDEKLDLIRERHFSQEDDR